MALALAALLVALVDRSEAPQDQAGELTLDVGLWAMLVGTAPSLGVVEGDEIAVPRPGDVYDPVEAGEPLPEGWRQVLPRDAIRPIYNPTFLTADEVDWPDDTLVIGVDVLGDARAYPVNVLNHREVVNDRVGGVPIVASWCPLCATAMVHRREVQGREIVLGVQGALWNGAMTWWDHQTGSVWSQPLGRAVAGPLAGTTLELLPSTLTAWGAWRQTHPDTLALHADGAPVAFQLEDAVLVVEQHGHAVAYPFAALAETSVVNDEVGDVPVAVVLDRNGHRPWQVFKRQLDGRVVTLSFTGDVLVDIHSGATWEAIWGSPRSGTTQALEQVPAFTAFEADFRQFFPEGRVMQP